MAITVTQALDSPTQWSLATGELKFIIHGTSDETEALAALAAEAPDPYDGLALHEPRIAVHGGDSFVGFCTYRTLTTLYAFSTGGGTEHITHSISTRNKYAVAGTAPDNKKAIGLSATAVEGCDVVVPYYQWTETSVLTLAQLTAAYIVKLAILTGKANAATYEDAKGVEHDEGEALFLGSSCDIPVHGLAELRCEFAHKANRTAQTIGDITGIAYYGWDHVWVKFMPSDQGTGENKVTIMIPQFVYVEKVYDAGDFTDLVPPS